MGFQQGLSGLNVSAKNLDVIGNNVANANTVGFKYSRTEFADIFATTLVGLSGTQAGIGAYVSRVAQQFTQGNITSSSNPLDLAINDNGFFRMASPAGAISYTRNGQFKQDKFGFLVDNRGSYLTGFGVTQAVDPLTGVSRDVADRGKEINLRIDPNGQSAPQATGASLGAERGALFQVNLNAKDTTPTNKNNFKSSTTPVGGPLGSPIPDATSYTTATSLTVYDSEGLGHSLTTFYIKTEVPNEWAVMMVADGASAANVGVRAPGGGAYLPQVNAGGTAYDPVTGLPLAGLADLRLTFDTNGQLTGYKVAGNAYPVTTPPDISLNLKGIADELTNINKTKGINTVVTYGAAGNAAPFKPLDFPLNFRGSTQFASGFSVKSQQDGFAPGQLAGFSISPTGAITVRYTNGQSRTEGFVRMASFPNVQGLQPAGNNQWVQTFQAGQEQVGLPGDAGFGTLQSGAMEDSNVDLTAELVNMITAQRSYQANAQTIKTQDSVLQTLVSLR
ncbi:flagellar hook protein FlgE [Chitinivorax tropicus]|uniref:Flagellar hook protein FlgE n=1 Tax=Chitinivorax tropicus TaxID=714531 RepID=A0A840MPS2_9PROT|nr:flagellar hook protein FlgE [Chitinivorax tropicus]MBB5018742.1 flagellar hook protein FlgE [Chitinivorax tropicus]